MPNVARVSAYWLTVAAIAGMTACHIAHVFSAELPSIWYTALMSLGGLTFPIMAFLVTEGYRHTSNVRRYAQRLAVFAVISQIPYSLVFEPMSITVGDTAYMLPFTGNVLFTLLLGLVLIYLHDTMKNRLAFWTVFGVSVCCSVVLDWGVIGPVMIMTAHCLPDGRERAVAPALIAILALGLPALNAFLTYGDTYLPELLYELVGGVGAAVLLSLYSGERGRPLKWFFYVYYPAHIAVLGIVHALMF